MHSKAILLGVLAAACSSSTFAQSWLPFNWQNAPLFQHLPVVDGHHVLDPWNYTQRLGAYKQIISSTSDSCLWPTLADHILWGLPLQFGWQLESGRLLVAKDASQHMTAKR